MLKWLVNVSKETLFDQFNYIKMIAEFKIASALKRH